MLKLLTPSFPRLQQSRFARFTFLFVAAPLLIATLGLKASFTTTPPDQLIFIDPTVDKAAELAQAANSTAEVIMLAPDRDGLTQISDILAARHDVAAIHLVAHGGPGRLQLGSSQLGLTTLADYAPELRRWSVALAPEANILIYGCNLAANVAGQTLVGRLSELTGATVAASTNPTGSAALDGDWALEFSTGPVTRGLAFNPSALAAYPALLDRPDLDTTGPPPILPPIDEDSSGGTGISLVDLVGQAITDTTNGAVEGIAVTGLTGSGTWQYSLDDGTSWTNLGPVSDINATVLRVLYPLYDGLDLTTPGAQGWLITSGTATQTTALGMTTFDSTTSNNVRDGYSNHLPNFSGGAFAVNGANLPTLNPTNGYTIRFEVQIQSESHASNDRAGLNVISVSSDTTKAIELSFWEDEIWAQDDTPLFTHAEGVSYDTTQNTVYDLVIEGSTYQLYANGVSILTGNLRDYSAWPNPFPSAPFFDVYETPSYLFLGDDTTSAQASFTFSRLEILGQGRLRFVPDQDFYGQATVTYRATNQNSQVATGQDATGSQFSLNSETASLTVNPLPDPPTISDIANQITEENTPLGPLTITISDPDVSANSLSLTATSSNPSLVPEANLTLGGSGVTRTLTLTPTTGQTGTTTITLTVDDGSLSASDSFIVTVEAAVTTGPNTFVYLPLIVRE